MEKYENLVVLRWVNGQLELDLNNLDKVLEIIKLNPDHQLAILSFIGERGSGKTFYTNLLIQNLRNNSTGGWLSQISGNHCKPLPGFPFNNKKREDCEFGAGEICLWAESFPIKNHGKSFMVLVFHVNLTCTDESQKARDSFDLFLALVSSRIVEIHWKTKEFRLPDIINCLLEKDLNLFGGILRHTSMLYLVRTIQMPSNSTTIVGKKAKRHFAKLFPKHNLVNEKMKYPQNVSIAYIYDTKEILLNGTGSLLLSTEMYHNVNAVINLIAEDEEILPKRIFEKGENLSGEELTVGKLNEFMQKCVDVVNDIVGQIKEADVGVNIQAVEADACVNDNMQIDEFGSNGDENSTTNPHTSIKSEEESNALEINDSSDEMQIDDNPEDENTITADEPTVTDMSSLVEFVIKKVEENVLKQLRNWEQIDGSPITTHLPDLPKDMEQSLNNFLTPIFHKTPGMTQQNREGVINSSLQQLTYFRQELHDIQNLLESFFGTIGELTTENGYILEERFSKLLEKMRTEAKNRLIHDESLGYTMRACDWLIIRYKDQNISFFSSLEIIYECMEQIREFYVDEMKRILMDGPYSSAHLLNIHSCITIKSVTALALIVSVNPEQLIKFQKNYLIKNLYVLKQSNRRKLHLFQKKVTNMIGKAKEHYDQDEKLNILLENTTFKGIEKAVIQNTHEQALNKAVLFLEERIVRGDIRLNEPVAGHKMTLIAVIESYWEDLRLQYM